MSREVFFPGLPEQRRYKTTFAFVKYDRTLKLTSESLGVFSPLPFFLKEDLSLKRGQLKPIHCTL